VLNEIHSPSGGKINFPSINPDKELLRC
jgi:hypothetical protein